MGRGLKVCSTPGCPQLTPDGRCATCRKDSDRARGTATQRGYGHAHRSRFRPRVLANADYICAVRGPGCTSIATVADHWPMSRRELVDAGLNPNDPRYGRALCKTCHDKETAANQPGGWHVDR